MRAPSLALASLLLVALVLGAARPAQAGPKWGFVHLYDPQVGLTLGYGLGTGVLGSGQLDGKDSRHLLVFPNFQLALSEPFLEGGVFAGRVDLRSEASFYTNFEPTRGFAYGLGLLLRHQWLAFGDWVPYLEAGAGFLDLDFDLQDQSDGFAFQPQGGLGLQWRFHPRAVLDAGVRLLHISNAYTHGRNFGIETFEFLLGVRWGLSGSPVLGRSDHPHPRAPRQPASQTAAPGLD